MNLIRIYIVDDHPLVVEGIRTALQNEADIQWAGHAINAAECLEFLRLHICDVILMDISLPGKSGIELCSEIKNEYPALKILALSTFHQGSYIAKMIDNGADGYVVKNADKNELLFAIRSVAQGLKYLSHEANIQLQEKREKDKNLPVLTRRELEVLKWIAKGMTNPQIAKELFISVDTVDSHRKNLLSKTQAANTASLVRFAMENQWLDE